MANKPSSLLPVLRGFAAGVDHAAAARELLSNRNRTLNGEDLVRAFYYYDVLELCAHAAAVRAKAKLAFNPDTYTKLIYDSCDDFALTKWTEPNQWSEDLKQHRLNCLRDRLRMKEYSDTVQITAVQAESFLPRPCMPVEPDSTLQQLKIYKDAAGASDRYPPHFYIALRNATSAHSVNNVAQVFDMSLEPTKTLVRKATNWAKRFGDPRWRSPLAAAVSLSTVASVTGQTAGSGRGTFAIAPSPSTAGMPSTTPTYPAAYGVFDMTLAAFSPSVPAVGMPSTTPTYPATYGVFDMTLAAFPPSVPAVGMPSTIPSAWSAYSVFGTTVAPSASAAGMPRPSTFAQAAANGAREREGNTRKRKRGGVSGLAPEIPPEHRNTTPHVPLPSSTNPVPQRGITNHVSTEVRQKLLAKLESLRRSPRMSLDHLENLPMMFEEHKAGSGETPYTVASFLAACNLPRLQQMEKIERGEFVVWMIQCFLTIELDRGWTFLQVLQIGLGHYDYLKPKMREWEKLAYERYCREMGWE